MTENQNTGLQIVNSLLNKKAKDTKELIKSQIIKGEANPCYVGIVLKKMAKIQEEVKKDKELDNLIIEDTKKYQEGSKKTFEVYGAKITVASGRSYWDYTDTDDPLLEALKNIQQEVTEQIKLREEEIQAKSVAWEKRNTPTGDATNFKISPFSLSWEHLPQLTWEESVGEIQTNPAIKKGGKDTLRYTV